MTKVSYNKTKIVATLGPASQSYEVIRDLAIAGVDVFRLNFSHGSHDDHRARLETIRSINKELGTNIAILQDLQGPKIRVGNVENNGVDLVAGQQIRITTEDLLGTAEKISTVYKALVNDVKVGDPILLDDGNLEFKVLSKSEGEVLCEVVHGGKLKSKKGINLPKTKVSAASLTPKDEEDLDFGLSVNVDWVALSFVRNPDDVHYLRGRIEAAGSKARIISKMERPEAIENMDAIIEASDAIMVARGDLGVEMPFEFVPKYQKEMVKKCNMAGKPVIVATQMFESMITNPRPTRAEASDVANAILDGADAVMLSAESASGSYPVLAVQQMTKVLSMVEENIEEIYYKNFELDLKSDTYMHDRLLAGACRVARDLDAKALTATTVTGFSAFKLAKHRPQADIFVFTDDEKLNNILNLLWGVRAFSFHEEVNPYDNIAWINNFLREKGYTQKGDVIVNTLASPGSKLNKATAIQVSVAE